jgi:hypothetical protein
MSLTPKRKAYEQLNQNNSSKRARTDLSIEQKRFICDFVQENPKLSQTEIASHFSLEFKLPTKIGRSTISDILKNRDSYEQACCAPSTKRRRAPKFEHLERALIVWGNDLAAHNIPISDEMNIEQAKNIGEEIGISKFEMNYSKGS